MQCYAQGLPCLCLVLVQGKGFCHIEVFGVVLQVKARGPPAEDDMTIAAHLLRLRNGAGQPLPDARMHAEVSVMFTAGAPHVLRTCCSCHLGVHVRGLHTSSL